MSQKFEGPRYDVITLDETGHMTEIIPARICEIAKAMESTSVLVLSGGIQAGKTTAMRMAKAREVKEEKE